MQLSPRLIGTSVLAALCTAVISLGVAAYFSTNPVSQISTGQSAKADIINRGSRPEGIDSFGVATRETALLVLSSRCRFCAASMPFYKRLSALPEMDGVHGRLVVLFIEGIDDQKTMTTYLTTQGLHVDQVVSPTKLKLPEVGMTPTLILLDSAGRVISSWAGRLSALQESDAIKLLSSTSVDGYRSNESD